MKKLYFYNFKRLLLSAAVMSTFLFLLAGGAQVVFAECKSALLGVTGTAEITVRGKAKSTLVEIDPATGATVRTIGPVGYQVTGLEYDQTTGKLFGTAFVEFRRSFVERLIEIDLTTGAGTLVSNTSTDGIYDLTVDSSGNLYGWEEILEDLALFDKNSGTFTRVDVTIGGNSGIISTGLAFDNSDTLYFLQSTGITTVDTGSGALTFIGNLPARALHGDFDPDTDLYYGVSDVRAVPRSLVVADLSAGTVISTFPALDDDIFALTFAGCPSTNNPPVASCQNVTVSAGADCTANASIDNGSNDLDGDAITITQEPAGPYALGVTEVTLIVTEVTEDESGESDSCTAFVTVEDNACPTVTAELVPVKVKKRKGCFRVKLSVEDNCDEDPQLVATINGTNGAGVVDGQLVELKHKKKFRVKVDDGGSDSSDDDSSSDDSSGKDCGTVRFEGPVFTLTATAIDSAGNIACEEAVDTVIFVDDDGSSDDEGSDDDSGSGHRKKRR